MRNAGPYAGAVAALLLLAAAALLPIELPLTVEAAGQVTPRAEWIVRRCQDGGLEATAIDRLHGSVDSYQAMTAERGDFLEFRLRPAVVPGSAVAAGDTVGWLLSRQLERRWAELRGDLDAELAALEADRSGSKEASVLEAQADLDLARQQSTRQESQVTRIRALWRRQVATDVDLETAEDGLRECALRVAAAEARLQSARTGMRPADLAWRQSRIEGLQRQLIIAEEGRRAALVTPLSGQVVRSPSPDTVLVVRDTTACVVHIAAPWQDRDHLGAGQRVSVRPATGGPSTTATLCDLGVEAHGGRGRQFLVVRALVDSAGAELVPGLLVRCSVDAGAVRPWQWVRRALWL